MAKYKIWLTVKDRYGIQKELDGGVINLALSDLKEDEINAIDKYFATDNEVAEATQKSPETIRYAGFELDEDTSMQP